MPGNTITIKGSKNSEWYINDSKMPELLELLEKIGFTYEDQMWAEFIREQVDFSNPNF